MLVAPELDAPPLRRASPPELVKAATPAAGANFSQAINDGYWWRILSIGFRATTDANAANRTFAVEYRDDEGVAFIAFGNPVTYPASTTNEDFYFSVWQDEGAWEVGTRNLGKLGAILLQPGQSFAIVVTNIQATDALTRVRFLRERFHPPKSADYPPP